LIGFGPMDEIQITDMIEEVGEDEDEDSDLLEDDSDDSEEEEDLEDFDEQVSSIFNQINSKLLYCNLGTSSLVHTLGNN
jgi:hypothetical protein